jgi:uncharacterized membrane protein YGL010W
MRNAQQLLASYAAYHRDRRNIATHFVGVPLIMFAVCILLSRPVLMVPGLPLMAGLPLSAAVLVFVISAIWYLTRGEFLLGLATSALIAAMVWAASLIAAASTGTWLTAGLGLFVLGWVIQFVGHYYEGRKPAFVDDISGLMVGPMFVVAEALFGLGWNTRLREHIERQVGPTHLRQLNTLQP